MPRKLETDPKSIWCRYEKGEAYNEHINLYETVETNKRFYAGDQWHGVCAPDLDKPVLNIIKMPVNYMVATLVSDGVSVSLTTSTPNSADEQYLKGVVAEIERIRERNNFQTIDRDAMCDSAVSGDACIYLHWDTSVSSGRQYTNAELENDVLRSQALPDGDIRAYHVDNRKCLFGNPDDGRIQEQPYLIIVMRQYLDDVIEEAVSNGMSRDDAEHYIKPDADTVRYSEIDPDDKLVTKLVFMWRDAETGTIQMTITTHDAVIREPWNTGLKLYPVAWMRWQKNYTGYHGVSVVEEVIPNQILVNKLLAEKNRIVQQYAFPKIVYDAAKFPNGWDSRIGANIAVNGLMQGMTYAEIFPPSASSAEVTELINLIISETNKAIGANDAALGQIKSDNTSAIIAMQEANTVPLEMQRQAYYDFEEQITRIMLDMLRAYADVRYVPLEDTNVPDTMPMAQEEIADGLPMELGDSVSMPSRIDDIGTPLDPGYAPQGTIPIDFSRLEFLDPQLKVDIGAGSRYSEIERLRTLDNLFSSKTISAVQYIDRIPDRYISEKEKLLEEIKAASAYMPGTPPNETNPNEELAVTGNKNMTAKNYIEGLRQGL